MLAVLRSERFVDSSPAQVYFTLLDEGIYLASVVELLPDPAGQRGGTRAPPPGHPSRQVSNPSSSPTAPLVVWSWDITKLKGPKRGEYFDLLRRLRHLQPLRRGLVCGAH